MDSETQGLRYPSQRLLCASVVYTDVKRACTLADVNPGALDADYLSSALDEIHKENEARQPVPLPMMLVCDPV